MAIYKNTLPVSSGATFLDVTHNLGTASIKVTKIAPSWSTAVWWSSKAANTVRAEFSDPAPAGAFIDVKVET